MYSRSRRLVMLALLAALLGTSLLAAAPSATAQTIRLGTRDTGYGWSFPDGEFPGAHVEDASGDLALEAESAAAPFGATGTHSTLDLVGLRLDEPDAEVLRLQIELAEIDPGRFLAEHYLTGVQLATWFTLGGSEYEVSGWLSNTCTETMAGVCEAVTQPALAYRAVLYKGTDEGRETIGLLPARVLAEDARVEVLVPRWAIDRSGPGSAPFAGDTVTNVRAESNGVGWCIVACVTLSDRLPDDGHVDSLHTLALDSNGARVGFLGARAVVTAADEFRVLPLVPRSMAVDVDPTGVTRFPLTIDNRGEHKVLLQPTVRGERAAVDATVPVSLEVPGRSERKLMVTLNESVEISPLAPLELRVAFKVLGSTVGAGDEILVTVRAVPPLSLEQNRLYFHTHGEDNTGLSEHGVHTFRVSRGVLNTLADDPLDHGDGATLHQFCFCINQAWGWSGEARLTSALALSNETPIVYRLTIDAPVAGSLRLEPALYLDDLLVSHVDRTVTLEQGENVVTVESLVLDEALDLPSGKGPFYLDLVAYFRPADLVLGELVGLAEPIDPRLVVQGASWIEIPIVEAAERQPAAEHLIVERAKDTDKVQYLNPGSTTLWNVTITNQANAVDTVTVGLDAPQGWRSRIAPDTRYSLGPGESVTVGVFLSAPADGKEGDTAKVSATIASKLGDGATVDLPLVAVVTKGVSVGEPYYEPDNATRERAASRLDAKESPGLGILPLIGLAALLSARKRRPVTGRSR